VITSFVSTNPEGRSGENVALTFCKVGIIGILVGVCETACERIVICRGVTAGVTVETGNGSTDIDSGTGVVKLRSASSLLCEDTDVAVAAEKGIGSGVRLASRVPTTNTIEVLGASLMASIVASCAAETVAS
jgi:hypothetical protein